MPSTIPLSRETAETILEALEYAIPEARESADTMKRDGEREGAREWKRRARQWEAAQHWLQSELNART